VLDARKAKPATITVDQAGAAPVDIQTYDFFASANGTPLSESAAGADTPGDLLTGSVGPAAPKSMYQSVISSDWAAPGPAGDFTDSPYAYHLAQLTTGKIPTGLVQHAKKSELARVAQSIDALGEARGSQRTAVFALPSGYISGIESFFPYFQTSSKPDTVTNYVTPGPIGWRFDMQNLGADGQPVSRMTSNSRVFAAKDYAQTVDRPVFGPGFFAGGPGAPAQSVALPTALVAQPLTFSGGNTDYAGIVNGTSNSVLYKNGTKVADSADVLAYEAPSEDASYKLTTSFSQQLVPVSTTVTGEWTFGLKKTTNPRGDSLPLFSLRFSPALDAAWKAPAGKTIDIPVTVSAQLAGTKVGLPTIDYSTDDGKTWQHVTVKATGANAWTASVTNPASGYVTLRASATDAGGATCSETIVRAYGA
jgi:hypothetical protein